MSVQELHQALLAKRADALRTNEADTQKGVANVHPNPPDRAPGTLNALWGDRPPTGPLGSPAVYGEAVERGAGEDRIGVIERLFDGLDASAASEHALMMQRFEHAAQGRPHSPLLQLMRTGERKTAHVPETLTDQVLRVAGRR